MMLKKLGIVFRLLLYKVSPVRKNRFIFTSLNGHYSDNPKYISEALHEINPNAEIIWLINKCRKDEMPKWVKWYDIDSIKSEWIRGSGIAYIDNVYCNREYTVFDGKRYGQQVGWLLSHLKYKKKQKAYTTFHGVGVKKIGLDQVGNSIEDFLCLNTTMILGSQYTIDIMKRVTFNKLRFLLMGSPRNDLLFQKTDRSEAKEKLGLPKQYKMVLYAPTFRNDGPDVQNKNIQKSGILQLDKLLNQDFFDSLSKKFGGEWILVCRFHYHVEKEIDWNAINESYPGRVYNGNLNDDMAEYLCAADILITDASTSMIDYAITRRPCFLFFPDYIHYRDEERGFYTPLESWPFPLAENFRELIDEIISFNQEEYESRINDMIKEMGSVDDEMSSKRIAEFILNECTQ